MIYHLNEKLCVKNNSDIYFDIQDANTDTETKTLEFVRKLNFSNHEEHLTVRARIDCHQEYFTITFIADSDQVLADYVSGRMVGVEGASVPDNERLRTQYVSIHRELYRTFWEENENTLGVSTPHRISLLLSDKYYDPKNESQLIKIQQDREIDPIERIIEFRGCCILTKRTDENEIWNRIVPNILSSDTSGFLEKDDAYAAEMSLKNRKFVRERAGFFDYFLGGKPSDALPPREDRNAILCEMLNGTAIYASSLGNLTKELGEFDFRSKEYLKSGEALSLPLSVEYLVVHSAASKEQIGRMIRLLHVLGELRHAALFDYGEIRVASSELRNMVQLWDSGYNYSSENPGRDFTESYHYKSHLTGLRFKFISELAGGDLPYRLSRSQFYAETYRSRLGDLQCRPIPGFQSYDAFMKRNVFIHFDKLKSVQERYRSARNSMEYLESQNQTEKSVDANEIAVIISILALAFAGVAIYDPLKGIAKFMNLNQLFVSIGFDVSWLVSLGLVFLTGLISYGAIRILKFLMKLRMRDVKKKIAEEKWIEIRKNITESMV